MDWIEYIRGIVRDKRLSEEARAYECLMKG